MAAPVTFTFDRGLLELSTPLNPQPAVAEVGTTTLTAEVDPDGDLTAPGSAFDFPFVESSGVTVDLTVEPAAQITGHYEAATGELTFSSTSFRLEFDGTVPTSYSCETGFFGVTLKTSTAVNLSPLSYKPYPGTEFDPGSSPPANGAAADGWAELPDATGSSFICESMPTGAGGLWLSNGIDQPYYPLDVSVSSLAGGGGIVSGPTGVDLGGPGLNCPGDCTEIYEPKRQVTLQASPAPGSTVTWGGSCAGSGPTCVVTMDAARSVQASFTGAASNGTPPKKAKKKCKRKKKTKKRSAEAAAKKCKKKRKK